MFLFALISFAAQASGMGGQSWSDDLLDDTGPGNLSIWNAIWILGGFAVTYWLAFSDKSPVAKRGFLWVLFFFLIAPTLVVLIVTYLTRGY